MQTRTTLGAAAVLAAVVAAGGLFTGGRVPAVAGEPAAKEPEGPAKGRRAEYIAAFNRGDAKTVAAFFAEDAEYVDQEGHEYKGRAAIEKLFERDFAANKGAKLDIHVTSVKQVTPDVVLEDGFTEVTTPGGGPGNSAHFSVVLVKKGGQWLLQSVRDTEARGPSTPEQLADLEWLIGDWEGETQKGESATASYEWAEGQHFIVSEFATTVNGTPVVGGTQWIGWDSVEKKIRSCTFYSRGGFGEASWSKDGNRWLLKTTAHTADGKTVTATNVLTKVDDDHMSWQVTKLTVDGQSMPDLSPVKMKRAKEEKP